MICMTPYIWYCFCAVLMLVPVFALITGHLIIWKCYVKYDDDKKNHPVYYWNNIMIAEDKFEYILQNVMI